MTGALTKTICCSKVDSRDPIFELQPPRLPPSLLLTCFLDHTIQFQSLCYCARWRILTGLCEAEIEEDTLDHHGQKL